MTQTVGEFEEKAAAAGLDLIISKPDEPVYIMADGRHVWRVIDNLMNNICKYAQPGSRVYVNLEAAAFRVRITFRNISKYPLNISGEPDEADWRRYGDYRGWGSVQGNSCFQPVCTRSSRDCGRKDDRLKIRANIDRNSRDLI